MPLLLSDHQVLLLRSILSGSGKSDPEHESLINELKEAIAVGLGMSPPSEVRTFHEMNLVHG